MDDSLAWVMIGLALLLLLLALVLLRAAAQAQQRFAQKFRQQRRQQCNQQRDRTWPGTSSLRFPQERGWMERGRLNGSMLQRTELEREE